VKGTFRRNDETTTLGSTTINRLYDVNQLVMESVWGLVKKEY
jgi:hypothetical protein